MAIHWGGVSGGGGGTVTSVGGTGTVNGITLTGTVTSSGSLTLGGSLSGVSLTTQVTGTLPLANGGTGQTTKAAAFDGLSPTSSAGDIIFRNPSTNTRLAIGTNGYYLRSNGSQPYWSALSVAFSNVTGTCLTTQGGTGTTVSPLNGQVLIGNSGSYTPANLTAGSGVSITTGPGTITISATGGGGGPTIDVINVNFSYENTSGFTPMVYQGVAPNPTDTFSVYFYNNTTSYPYNLYSSPTSITITDSSAVTTTYFSGTDFTAYPPLEGHSAGQVVSLYGLKISNATMLAVFTNTAALYSATPSLTPGALGMASFDNPQISVNTPSGFYTNNDSGNLLPVYVTKIGSVYNLYYGSYSAMINPYSGSVNDISIDPTGSTGSTYYPGTDFTYGTFTALSGGMCVVDLTVINATLQSIFDNSIKP